mmetsp:Transcript_5814/g.14000  ORF Transcript_5814/g.14000 Transcript_5814/m.14000 type:complete len:83 (+) Transcript_5814:704-952(+)
MVTTREKNSFLFEGPRSSYYKRRLNSLTLSFITHNIFNANIGTKNNRTTLVLSSSILVLIVIAVVCGLLLGIGRSDGLTGHV